MKNGTCEPGQVTEKTYLPEWPQHNEIAKKAGHGEERFLGNYYFAEAIRKANSLTLMYTKG